MPRGVTTLETMLRNLRLETRRSADANFGLDERDALVYLLQRTQYFLYWDFDWQFLKVRRDLTLQQDQRYYDFDNDLDYERIVAIKGNGYGTWVPLERGILMTDYDIHNSDDGETASPARKWDIIDAGSGEQFEVWPVPDQDGETVRKQGFRKLGALVADSDVCTLDDMLIVLFAAAHLSVGEDDKRAQKLLDTANRMYMRMRGGSTRTNGGYFVVGGAAGCIPDPHCRPVVLAPQSGSSSSSSGGGSGGGGSGGGAFSDGFSGGFS